MINPAIIEIVRKLPQKPGVYQFYSASGEILYVGKAKNIRKRVNSYFTHTDTHNYKHHALIGKINEIRYVIVENESDALLLENNFIKENQPRYNILLKDDKTYPWITIKNERFPRVMVTRNYISDGSSYFGPYTSVVTVKTLLELIRQLYKIRTCNYLLNDENIIKLKYKKCLEFQLGNCKAPCEGLQSEEEYNQSIGQIRDILKGNLHNVIRHLYSLMKEYAQDLMFEEAEVVRHKISLLERFKSKSTIVNAKIDNVDVFGFVEDDQCAYVNYLKIVNGAIVQAHNIEIIKRLDEEKEEILGSVIFSLRRRFSSNSSEVILPFKPSMEFDQLRFNVPLRGDKRKLLDLSLRNAASFKNDQELNRAAVNRVNRDENLLARLKDDLRLKRIPMHIECFDNSNIQGTDPVASCVVFKSGKPAKALYRHFNIKTVQGPNDFASMEEIVYRRYRRMLDEQGVLPDLIIIDGGKGQLHAAVIALKKLDLYGAISIIGIAKRLEEIYVPEDPVALYMDKNSPSLRLIQKIRDEAHRFGVTFHRNKRSKAQIDSVFVQIPGIGEKTRDKILKVESDINQLRRMSSEELTKLAGKKAAQALTEYFRHLPSLPETKG
jgi:excinuclease ABC subunit C